MSSPGFCLQIPLPAINRCEDPAEAMIIQLLPPIETFHWFSMRLHSLPGIEFRCSGTYMAFQDGEDRRRLELSAAHVFPERLVDGCPFEFAPLQACAISRRALRVACALACALRVISDLSDPDKTREVPIFVLGAAIWLAERAGLSCLGCLLNELREREAGRRSLPGTPETFRNNAVCAFYPKDVALDETGFIAAGERLVSGESLSLVGETLAHTGASHRKHMPRAPRIRIPLPVMHRCEEPARGMRVTLVSRSPSPRAFRLRLLSLPEIEFDFPATRRLKFQDGTERIVITVEAHHDMPPSLVEQCPFEFDALDDAVLSEKVLRTGCAVAFGLRLLAELENEALLSEAPFYVLGAAAWLARVCGLDCADSLLLALDARDEWAPTWRGTKDSLPNPMVCELLAASAASS